MPSPGPRNMPNSPLFWERPSHADSGATVHSIEHFNARGMRRVYGRCDHLNRPLNMDIWRTRDSRLLVRFWSRNEDVDCESWEINLVPDAQQLSGPPFDDGWIPNCLREEYERWAISNI
jgi:hypothetical protein